MTLSQGSSLSSSFQSSRFNRQKLLKTAQAIAILFANEILLSSSFPSIRQQFFNMPKVHSTATLAADKAFPPDLLLLQEMAFGAKKLEGMHCLQLDRV